MPPKKRKAAIQPSSSNAYKRKLKRHKLELSSSDTVTDEVEELQIHSNESVKDENQKYTFHAPRHQSFSIPDKILYYMARNPSTVKCHQNLFQTCKLFFLMSRIIPIRNAYKHTNAMNTLGTYTSNVKGKIKCKRIDLDNLSFCKLWFYDYLEIENNSMPNFVSTLVQHIDKCSLVHLTLKDQTLTFSELQILTSGEKLRQICFNENIVKNVDGSIIEFERVFELLVCGSLRIKFPGEQHGIGKDTAAKMAEFLGAQEKQCRIELANIPQDFDFRSFTDFLKANMVKQKHILDLWFADTISPECKNQLQEVVNEIIQIRGIKGDAVPIIFFPDQDSRTLDKLCEMRYLHSTCGNGRKRQRD